MQITEMTVTLDYVEPKVCRRLEVLGDISLDRLHLILQAAFGWQNAHLYQFCVGEPYQMGKERWVIPDFVESPEDLPADRTTLAQAIAKAGAAGLIYLYDFGDDWIHRIEVGSTGDAEPGQIYPRLTNAIGTCPPEDIGGPPGYQMFAQAMADPKHPEHKELKEWYGGDFDPVMSNTDQLRSQVLKLAKQWKRKRR